MSETRALTWSSSGSAESHRYGHSGSGGGHGGSRGGHGGSRGGPAGLTRLPEGSQGRASGVIQINDMGKAFEIARQSQGHGREQATPSSCPHPGSAGRSLFKQRRDAPSGRRWLRTLPGGQREHQRSSVGRPRLAKGSGALRNPQRQDWPCHLTHGPVCKLTSLRQRLHAHLSPSV